MPSDNETYGDPFQVFLEKQVGAKGKSHVPSGLEAHGSVRRDSSGGLIVAAPNRGAILHWNEQHRGTNKEVMRGAKIIKVNDARDAAGMEVAIHAQQQLILTVRNPRRGQAATPRAPLHSARGHHHMGKKDHHHDGGSSTASTRCSTPVASSSTSAASVDEKLEDRLHEVAGGGSSYGLHSLATHFTLGALSARAHWTDSAKGTNPTSGYWSYRRGQQPQQQQESSGWAGWLASFAKIRSCS